MVNDWSFRNDAFRGPDIPYKSIPNCVVQSPLAQLYIQGTITNIVRRKVHLTVVLYDDLIPNTDDIDDINIDTTTKEHRIIYATGEGIVVMNHEIL